MESKKGLAVKQKQGGQPVITKEDIKNYFCPLATEKEVFMALGVINSLNLNPHTREVHLVKYSANEKLNIVVGYEVYLKRADRTGKLDGWECGITDDGENAWVKIYRKDWKTPFYWEVKLSEFNKQQATWKQIPTFMGKKVAIAQGFRLAFPDELGGMPYTQEEYDMYITPGSKIKPAVEMPKELPPIVEEEQPPELAENGNGKKEETAFSKMLVAFAAAKKALGDEEYYKILGGNGYTHANEIRLIAEGKRILDEMKLKFKDTKNGK